MSHPQVARLVGGLLLAVAFILLLMPTNYERSDGRKRTCGTVVKQKYPDLEVCDTSTANRVGVVLIVGVLGGGAFIVASQLGKRSSDGMSSPTGSTPKQSGTSVRPPVPPSADQRSGRTTAGLGPLECSGCGQEVHEEAKFCPHCGERFDDPSCPNPNCDAKPSKNGRFCAECGWDLKTET
jgi:hypothetical protein